MNTMMRSIINMDVVIVSVIYHCSSPLIELQMQVRLIEKLNRIVRNAKNIGALSDTSRIIERHWNGHSSSLYREMGLGIISSRTKYLPKKVAEFDCQS